MKKILDPCCGSKMLWFQKNNTNTIYGDIRQETHVLCDGRTLKIDPDEIIDFRKLPYKDNQFDLIMFDPPHMKTLGKKSWMRKKYGVLNNNWKEDISKGFNECYRCLRKGGTLIFKWNINEVKLKEVLSCFSKKPLFGHTSTINLKTFWIVFYKNE